MTRNIENLIPKGYTIEIGKHKVEYFTDKTDDFIVAKCSCTAEWVHSPNAEFNELEKIFKAHESYDRKGRTETN